MRVSMATLVGRVRALVDSVGQLDWTFTDDQVQDALDQHRCEYRYLQLTPLPTKAASGTTYVDFSAPFGDWDTATVLYDNDFDAQSPSSSDFINGRWVFSAEPTRPITLVGFQYDRYAAAVDLLKQLLVMGRADATLRLTIEAAILNYQGMTRAISYDLERTDVTGDIWP